MFSYYLKVWVFRHPRQVLKDFSHSKCMGAQAPTTGLEGLNFVCLFGGLTSFFNCLGYISDGVTKQVFLLSLSLFISHFAMMFFFSLKNIIESSTKNIVTSLMFERNLARCTHATLLQSTVRILSVLSLPSGEYHQSRV